MSWEEAVKTEESIQSGGKYLKVDSGQKVEVVFLGEPETAVECFDERTNKKVTFDPSMHNGNPDIRQTTRFAFNVAVMPSMEVKIFKCGVTLFRDIKVFYEKGRLEKYTFEISKTGERMDTKWRVTQENEITAKQQKQLATLELHDLSDSPF